MCEYGRLQLSLKCVAIHGGVAAGSNRFRLRISHGRLQLLHLHVRTDTGAVTIL